MPQIIWTPTALSDVQRLYRFLRPKSPTAAERAITVIRSSVALLADNPEIGRSIDDLGSGYRERIVPFGSSAYVVLYRQREELLLILAIRHGREAGYPSIPPEEAGV